METHDVVVVAYDGAELVDIASVTTAYDMANRIGADPPYRVVLANVGGGDICCDSGLRLRADARLSAIERADTVVVSGGRGHSAATEDRALVRHLQRLAATATRVSSVCTGATLLAEAGLLNGRCATTHWIYADKLAERYPAVSVDSSPIFVRDGRVSTSGGVTASLDLTLAFIEEDHGPDLARWVAMGMVTYLQRPGNQAQMSVFTAAPRPDHDLVRAVLDRAVAHPDGDLSTSTLAAHVGVSVRQLTRLFQDNVGEPPGLAIRRVRLEIAAGLLATTDMPLSQVARKSGFSSGETLRQTFVVRFGVSPRTFRQTQSRPTETIAWTESPTLQSLA